MDEGNVTFSQLVLHYGREPAMGVESNKYSNNKGFTYIGMILVIVILGILGAMSLSRLSNITQTAEKAELPQSPILAAEESADLATARALHSVVNLLINEWVSDPTDQDLIASRMGGGFPLPQTGGIFTVHQSNGEIAITWGDNEEYAYPAKN